MSNVDSIERRGALGDRVSGGEAALTAQEPSSAPELRALFHAHYASIWRLLRRLGVAPGQLDDAAQEVFWVAARRLADIRSGSEHAFLYGIAIRIASNVHRREQAVPPHVDVTVAGGVPDGRPSPEEALEQHRRRELLDVVLGRLPDDLRSVFVLFELEGLSVPEIAEIHAIPVGTASSRLRRAREEFHATAKRVRATLQGKGGSY